MSPRSTAAIASALLAGVLLLPSAANAATRAEYVAQADPYCAAANRDINRLNKRLYALHKAGDYKAAGAVLKKTGTRLSSSIMQVRAIVPPPGDEATIDSWLALIEQVARNNKRMGRAQARQDFKEHDRLFAQNQAIRAKAHALVAAFGFEDCA